MSRPRDRLLRLIHGGWMARCVYLAVRLGLVEALREGPRSGLELARAAGVDEPALRRLLDTLVSLGLLLKEQDRYDWTDTGRALEELADYALLVESDECRAAWGLLESGLRGQGVPFELAYDQPFLRYAEDQPEFSRLFARAMAAKYAGVADSIAASWDFQGRVVDVGGGLGQMLWAITARFPSVAGVLFDLPGVIEKARARPENAHLELVAGDVFAEVPAGASTYFLKSFLNNWPDAEARRVLETVRRALGPEGRVLICEPLPGFSNGYARLMDLQMLALQGSQIRTVEQLEELLAGAGLTLDGVHSTGTEFQLVEARADVHNPAMG